MTLLKIVEAVTHAIEDFFFIVWQRIVDTWHFTVVNHKDFSAWAWSYAAIKFMFYPTAVLWGKEDLFNDPVVPRSQQPLLPYLTVGGYAFILIGAVLWFNMIKSLIKFQTQGLFPLTLTLIGLVFYYAFGAYVAS